MPIRTKDELLSISKYIGVDAYFPKKPFVTTHSLNGFNAVTHLRDDACSCYKKEAKIKLGIFQSWIFDK